jgi:adenosylmethionine-8-amino-7-oxononanoate aminotransferase
MPTAASDRHRGHVFPRRVDAPLPVAANAHGAWIEDQAGRRYLDASGGAVVVNVGHGRKRIARAVAEQIRTCDYVHPTMFTTPVVEELAAALSGHAPAGIDRFYFLSGGGEANEAAIKLARQVHLAAGRPAKFRLIARWQSYHGLTLGALAAMGRTTFRTPFAPMLSDAVHIPAPYCLRCAFGLTHPDCALRCALALEDTIQHMGPETVSAFLVETVSGGSLAAYRPPQGYLTTVRDICDRHDVLLILDEVMCGMGRTGEWFACQHEKITPDLVTLGKGLAGGALAISALGVRQDHFESVCANGGNFVHGGTFTHHGGAAAAAALATIRILEEEQLVLRVAQKGPMLGAMLNAHLGNLPWVGDVRGLGFLWGVELVEDRNTLKPFARENRIAEKVWQALFDRGVLTYKSTGFAHGEGDALIIAPPFIMSDDDLRTVCESLGAAVKETLGR